MIQQMSATTSTSAAQPRATGEAADTARMDLAALVRRCASESERFYHGQPHDTRYAYELFRRALVDRNEAAWEQIFVQYRGLVESWVRRSGAFASSGETSEYFVTAAFTRFWRAIPPARFAQFPTLPSLLQYLQRCAGCVVIDSVRAQSWAEVLPEDSLPHGQRPLAAPDEEAMERVSREEFWALIGAQLHDEAERVVVHDSYVLGMKPGDICERRPDLFASVHDVYNVKRNVLGRLSRNQELRRLLAS
jgi:DNA-directed RNA polymerase specialized sigma24 family protein